MDQSIAANRRGDGLFHSYNLIHFGKDGYDVENLYEMLEGQVAVLKSGYLSGKESLSLLDRLRASSLYRSDQNSYLLYPAKKQKLFLEKNVIPRHMVEENRWIQNEITKGNRNFVERDVKGNVHFNPAFRNASELSAALENEKVSGSDLQALRDIYESVFQHREFTGRSGTMYKYEGLGCIYWHMVSKLLLATGDIITREAAGGAGQTELFPLLAHFDQIKAGLGLHKSPAQYGAFPVDPYSHTPAFAGAQQPGMTGQVKEDVITRFTELGVLVEDGEIRFAPVILQRSEFLSAPEEWKFSAGKAEQNIQVEAGSLAFSLCGIPVIYRLAARTALQIVTKTGVVESLPGNKLGKTHSRSVFQRDKRILQIIVDVPESGLR